MKPTCYINSMSTPGSMIVFLPFIRLNIQESLSVIGPSRPLVFFEWSTCTMDDNLEIVFFSSMLWPSKIVNIFVSLTVIDKKRPVITIPLLALPS
jgi:hypothetical protein